MAAWHEPYESHEGTTVSATERLRALIAALRHRLRRA